MDTKYVIYKWKQFVLKNKELRAILLLQYRSTFLKLIFKFREYKKRQFQNYIVQNASQLIQKALFCNHQKFLALKRCLQDLNVQTFYVHQSQIPLLLQIVKLQIKPSYVNTIRFPLKLLQNHNKIVPFACRQLRNAVSNAIIVTSTSQLRPQRRANAVSAPQIKYPFLLRFSTAVTVKRSQKPFTFSPQERHRYLTLLKSIDHFQSTEYRCLGQFDLNPAGLKALLLLHYHNSRSKDTERIDFFFDYQVKRVAAACRIQKFFRAYWSVNKFGMRMCQIMKLINQSRAIFVIQRWFRRIRGLHRQIFFKEISFNALQIQTKCLYLSISIYENLLKIMNHQQYCLKFIEQHCQILSDAHCARLKFHVPNTDFYGQQTYLKKVQELNELEVKCFPQWLLNQIQIVPESPTRPIQASVLRQKEPMRWQPINRSDYKRICHPLQNLADEGSASKDDIYGLLHKGARICFEQIDNHNYIRFEYASITEARYRMIATALLTYRFKYNGIYVHMLNDSVWENLNLLRQQMIKANYFKLQRLYQLDLKEPEVSVQIGPIKPPIVLSDDFDTVKAFESKAIQIQLQFYNDKKRVQADLYFNQSIVDHSRLAKEQQFFSANELSQECSSISTQLPIKLSLLNIDPPSQKPSGDRNKTNLETIYNALPSKLKYSVGSASVNTSVVKDLRIGGDWRQESISYRHLGELNEIKQLKSQYQDYLKKVKEYEATQKRQKVSKVKQSNSIVEKKFEHDFIQLTSLIQRQERNVGDIIRKKGKACRSVTQNQQTLIKQAKRADLSQTPVKERYQFPAIQRKPPSTVVSSRLSNYHRHAIFPEELYAISNQNSLQF